MIVVQRFFVPNQLFSQLTQETSSFCPLDRKIFISLPMQSDEDDGVHSGLQVQRLYERYLRAESFRKALVYQKRYLLLLLGGFQECEQATLCLIARMGARPSPPLPCQRRPLGRFRTAVRVVIAVSRYGPLWLEGFLTHLKKN